jgi:amidase
VVRNRLFGANPEVDALANAAIAVLKAQGAVVVDPANIATLGTFDDMELEVLLHEFKHDLPRFFGWWGPAAPIRTVADIIAFNKARASQELVYFGQELLELAEQKGPLTTPAYVEALTRSRRLAREEGIDLVMRTHRLDALVAPTGGAAWELDVTRGDTGSAFTPSPSTVSSVAGYPHITVPMGFVDGLPVGFSFFGRAWSEATLIKLAYAYEQATHHRKPPRY